LRIEIKDCGKEYIKVEYYGELDPDEVIGSYGQIIKKAEKSKNVIGVLADTTGITTKPGDMETYSMVVAMEVFRERHIKFAAIMSEDWQKKLTFAGTVAKNRNIHYARFAREEDAVEWIRAT
jgi:hypothetical protein